MRRLTAILLSSCAIGALAGCGTPPISHRVETLMRQLLETQSGLHVRSVSCPQNIDLGRGAVTYCTATLTNGHTVRMAATPASGGKEIHVAPAEMIADEIQNFIVRAYALRRVTVTARCPQHEPIVVASTFDCVATGRSGRSTKVQITVKPGGAFSTAFVR